MKFTVVLIVMFMTDSEVEPLFIYLGGFHEMPLCVFYLLYYHWFVLLLFHKNYCVFCILIDLGSGLRSRRQQN